jgi:hypothetical protein
LVSDHRTSTLVAVPLLAEKALPSQHWNVAD